MTNIQSALFEYLKEQPTDAKQKSCADVIIYDSYAQALLAAHVGQYLGYECFVLPEFVAKKGDDLRAFCAELLKISETLSHFYNLEKKKKLILSPANTISHPLPAKKHLEQIKLKLGDKLDTKELKERLLRCGYSLVDIVQDKAEASFRGEIIDIFDVASSKPVRILLDFDEIESIKSFDEATQKSDNELKEFSITPFVASFSSEQFERLSEQISHLQTDFIEQNLNSYGLWYIDDLVDFTSEFCCIFASEDIAKNNAELGNSRIPFIPEPKRFKDFEPKLNAGFFDFHSSKKITLLSATDSAIRALSLNENKNLETKQSPAWINIISDDEIIVSLNRPNTKRREKKASVVIGELNAGDFVVHEDYGIGRFVGLEQARVLGVTQEFVVITYQGGDRLLLPAGNLNLIDKYIANSGSVPQIDKLGKGGFAKIKEKVKEKLFAIANAIIELAAKRELIDAKVLEVGDKYAEFKKMAGFLYTTDQQNAVDAIFSDLKSGKVMDRLLSGDVGFGKTEVAMNAIFASISSKAAALFFVPTTLLCSQHYATLKARFEPFGIKVYRIDRFSSTKHKNEAKKALANGEPVVVIGTHALLSLEAKNIGVIIIDEEHKFGVKQKEKLKQISQNSHILSMSATPIPRSLNMALSSVKTYSSLTTPPLDRQDVRTFVLKWNETAIKEAIMRELRRGGQIFYVHNLIADLPRIEREIKAIVPTLRILVLHGKMDAKTSEEEILNFADKKYDLLLCTSIVESGIHLPNANTIFIDNSNKFGIADLHQLRGRVGRSKAQGFCYFLVAEDAQISAEASKRLLALEANSFLGSGAVLAHHDLEIRGGGNILGDAQSGHIEAIGYSLYLKMLESEINRCLALKNDEQNTQKESQNVDIRLSINAFINSELIDSNRVRLELYRRLSKCASVDEVYEIGAEIEDRFGKLDTFTKQFLDVIIIKILAKSLGIKAISNFEQNISFTPINGEKTIIKAKSKDEDDIIEAILNHLRSKNANN